MARRRKTSLTKQLAIVGSVLICFQLAYLFLVPRAKTLSIKDAIQNEVSKQSVDEKRRAQLQIQLSIEDYTKRQGQFPDSLTSLIPVYFEDIPRNPDTGDEFQYLVNDGKYYVGDAQTIASIKSGGNGGPPKGPSTVVLNADSTANLPPAVQQALIESLRDEGALQQAAFVYDPTGKRDPFRPFDFAPKVVIDESKSPLERYDISQLKLTAVVTGLNGELKATVENAVGKGYIVQKGMKIGLNSGDVVEVRHDSIVIVETTTDFTGQKKTKTIEMKLRTKDQEDLRRGPK